MASEYKLTLTGGKQFKLLSNYNLGYLKKGETSIVRLSFSPDSMNQEEATLSIANNFFKEIYRITGKPLHSRKIELDKQIRVTKDVIHEEIVTLPWDFKTQTTAA